MALFSVVSQMGATLFLAVLAKLAGLTLLWDLQFTGTSRGKRFLELPFAAPEAAGAFLAFALRVALCFSSMTRLIDSRSFSMALGFLGSIACIMLYWFAQEDYAKLTQFWPDQPH
jgi:hypothetical protein